MRSTWTDMDELCKYYVYIILCNIMLDHVRNETSFPSNAVCIFFVIMFCVYPDVGLARSKHIAIMILLKILLCSAVICLFIL
jgi:hypothetical protein